MLTGPKKHAKELKQAATNVICYIGANTIKVATGGVVDPVTLAAALQNDNDANARERLDKYSAAHGTVKEFRQRLEAIASSQNAPLVIMVDELDRCRPSYAVELLETAKHLFDVNGIVFALAVNREQLQYAIKALYGTEFDAETYLRRFFDIDVSLPRPLRVAFINKFLPKALTDDPFAGSHLPEFLDKAAFLSLRDIQQELHRLDLALRSLPEDEGFNPTDSTTLNMVAFALVFRVLAPDFYHQFVNGYANDDYVATNILQGKNTLPEIGGLRWREAGKWFQEGLVWGHLQNYPDAHSNLRNEIEKHDPNYFKPGLQKRAYGDTNNAFMEFRIAYRHLEYFT